MKKSIGTALILAGLVSGLSGFRLHSAGWLMAGLLLFLIGLVLFQRPTLDRDRDCVDSDPSDLAYPAELAYLDDAGNPDNGDSSAGDDAGGDLDASASDFG